MPSRKYIVVRTREFRELLDPEEQTQMAELLKKLTDRRREKFPGKADPMFFTINVADQYAQAALEAYMRGIDEDDTNAHNQGVKDARQAAWEARQYAMLYCPDTKLPS